VGENEQAIEGLIAHAEKVREQGFGYEHLLTAHRIVTVADNLGRQDIAAEWWARTEYLAESCGAEPLLERWRAERQKEGYLPEVAISTPAPPKEENYTSSRLSEELPRVDLAAFGIITQSRRMNDQAAWMGRIGPTNVPILIRGESGTGKELFAHLAHQVSDRKDQPFLPINCGALPRELMESELFGHRRGAFTGAVTDKNGLFRSAHRGTIFLDEIGELPPSAQTKLLRVIETGELRPVGETRTENVNVRIVAATNVDLKKAVAKGEFRKDLFFRLKGLEIYLPPLRERVGDIPLLAEHFVKLTNKTLRKSLTLPFDTKQWLMGLPWQGNVRELRLAIERAAALGPESGILQPYHFISEESIERVSLPNELEAIERARVRNALEASDWNVTSAAELLGMSRTTLSGRLKRLGLQRPPKDETP
jgi:two-component system response regulator PilR (NtrC family)